MFEYGMMYFCTLLSLNVADSTLELLSLAGSSISSPTSYVGYFADLLSAVLTGRFMLDIWETKAKIERGGATNSGSFSVDLNGANGDGLTGHSDGFIGTLEFTHSYGGLARSCLDHEDYEDGDEDVQSEIVDANASANVEEARFDWTGAGDAQSEITGGSGRFDERLLV
ncbi:hypothetical protein C8Q77DRAFT_823589 [Trametes polyzona]|nr:hypothetical protein C8Q77DRAFT_823589 [Trametes polyzona]